MGRWKFVYKSEEEIKRSMLDDVKNTVDKSQNSLVHDAISPAAIELALMYMNLERVASKLDVENLEGEELERFIYQRTGIRRKQSTKALTIVVISGQEGARIRKGDLVSTKTVNFVSLENRELGKEGQISVFVSCENYGSIGNFPANSINKFPISISGLVDVYNPAPVTNGYDAELDNDLRQRYYDKLQRPGKAGNKYHYLEWAKEVTGVGDAKVISRWDGPLSVKVIIINSNKQVADEDLISRVKAHIESQRPFGANVTVVSAKAKEVNISVDLTVEASFAIEEVKREIEKYLKEMAFKSEYISYAQIGSIIINSKGVIDYTNLKINNGVSNILIEDEEVAVMGVINCTS